MGTTEVVSLMECLGDIEDTRKPSKGTLRDLREVLVIAICATLSNVDNFDDIALWARTKEAWLPFPGTGARHSLAMDIPAYFRTARSETV